MDSRANFSAKMLKNHPKLLLKLNILGNIAELCVHNFNNDLFAAGKRQAGRKHGRHLLPTLKDP